MEDYRFFLGTKSETWQQAIVRFKKFREVEMKDYFSSKDYPYRFADNKAYSYHVTRKVTASYIADFEKKREVTVPEELIALLSGHGPFTIGDSLLEIFGGNHEEVILTLPEILVKYGHAGFVDQIGKGMLRSLTGFYFFFGVSFPDSDEMSFLYFNKAGNFGKMLFAANNPSLVLHKILPSMFNGSIDKYTLDTLIGGQIDRVIINALTVKGYID